MDRRRETLGVDWGQREEGICGQGSGECVYNQEKGKHLRSSREEYRD